MTILAKKCFHQEGRKQTATYSLYSDLWSPCLDVWLMSIPIVGEASDRNMSELLQCTHDFSSKKCTVINLEKPRHYVMFSFFTGQNFLYLTILLKNQYLQYQINKL